MKVRSVQFITPVFLDQRRGAYNRVEGPMEIAIVDGFVCMKLEGNPPLGWRAVPVTNCILESDEAPGWLSTPMLNTRFPDTESGPARQAGTIPNPQAEAASKPRKR